MTLSTQIRADYEKRFLILENVAARLERHIAGLLVPPIRIDRISARAKSPDRYYQKATKPDDDGKIKYDNPQYQIQDQIGARITVFYLSDIDRIRDSIESYFQFIEVKTKAPSSDSEFGYFGLHFILEMPADVIPEGNEDDIPEFFELQIKTLFQHAWSEAHHDLGYKSLRDSTGDERRKVAFTAAQAWGADTIFQELANSLVLNDNDIL